jgi:N-acetylglucosamine transport system permease protein
MYHHKYRLIVPFLAPAIILYAVFVLWPFAQSFYVSLTQWQGVSANKKFVGLSNFRQLVQDPNFTNALKHNGEMLVVLPLVTLTIALFFAALFTQGGSGIPGAGFYRVVFFFPQVMSAVIIGILWSFIYHPTLGLLNSFLGVIGLGAFKETWLGDPRFALWAVAAVFVWQAVGFYLVFFIAGMQSIPTSFYEAARLDGASRWTSFWGITMPLMWEHIRVGVVYIGIAALDLFTIVQVMTEGGPNRASDVLAHYMWESAFTNSQFGYATAIGVTLLILTLLLSVVTLRLTQRERYEF